MFFCPLKRRLEEEFRLIAMDHTHCFTCGRDLTARLDDIDNVRDERLYGRFPEFVARLQRDVLVACRERLRQVEEQAVQAIVQTVPREWAVPQAAEEAWQKLICRRAAFVAEASIDRLLADCPNHEP
jgi:hypothetical protein